MNFGKIRRPAQTGAAAGAEQEQAERPAGRKPLGRALRPLLALAVAAAVALFSGCSTAENTLSQWASEAASAAGEVSSASSAAGSGADAAGSAVAGPAAAGTAVAAGAAADPAGSSAAMPVEYYFPRDGQPPKPVLLGIFNSAKSSLDLAIYSFTDTDFSDALIAAKRRGVTVRVITDRVCSSNSAQKKLLNSLKANGIPVKINTHKDLMHMKVTIADRSVVTTGSFNYTKTAENYNDEVFVVLHSAKAGQDFGAEFDRMWNDSGKFTQF